MATLDFPDDRIVGTLDWIGAYQEETGPVLATGAVEVPDDKPISLRLFEATGAEPSPGGGWTIKPAQRPSHLGFLYELPDDSITSLNVGRTDPGSFKAVVHLQPGLRHLVLAFSDLGDEVLRHIARLTRLVRLQTFGNRFTDSAVQQLRALTQLEALGLEEESLSAAAFEFVAGLPNLKSLDLQDVPISSEHLDALRVRLPSVTFY